MAIRFLNWLPVSGWGQQRSSCPQTLLKIAILKDWSISKQPFRVVWEYTLIQNTFSTNMCKP